MRAGQHRFRRRAPRTARVAHRSCGRARRLRRTTCTGTAPETLFFVTVHAPLAPQRRKGAENRRLFPGSTFPMPGSSPDLSLLRASALNPGRVSEDSTGVKETPGTHTFFLLTDQM